MATEALLLVEGKDDRCVVDAITKNSPIHATFEIRGDGGISWILETLPVQVKGSELNRLGVIVDADTNLERRWQAITDILKKEGYTFPCAPSPDGTILDAPSSRRPKVGIWIMPDNQLPGILEDFARLLVPDGDALLPYAQECVGNIPAGHRRFPPQHRSKAEIHSWLAWQAEPGRPLGTAITARYLDADAAQARVFFAWFMQLYG